MVERRQSIIKPHELAKWFKAVLALGEDWHNSKSATMRDYLLLILFTGLRRKEAASIKWREQIDFEAKKLTVYDTKNHQSHTLPLSDFLYDLLKNRIAQLQSDYLFPSESREGYIVEPRKQIQKITQASGVVFTLHDLRRTFITIAESLDIPAFALKRLLNHKMKQDVTAGYIVIDAERLRKPMQQITDSILSYAGFNTLQEINSSNPTQNNIKVI